MNISLRTVFNFAAVLAITTVVAQNKTKEGFALDWNNDIVVVPTDSLTYGDRRFPAYMITVFESDGGDALSLWKNEMKSKCKSVGGSNPTKAENAVMPEVHGLPLLILANATTDKKAELGQLTITYLMNDSVLVSDQAKVQQSLRMMAVDMNKANVQKQIDGYVKTLDKATDKLEGAEKDIAKNKKSVDKANKALAKAKIAISKITAENMKLKANVTGQEGKFATTNDPKDLKALTKARGKLASSESSLAKQLKAQTKALEDVGKYEGKSPDQVKEQAERAETQQENGALVEKLRAKLAAIR